MPWIGNHVTWPDSTACEMSSTWTHMPAVEYRRGAEDNDAAGVEAEEEWWAAARSLSSYLFSASSCRRRSFIAFGRTDGMPALGPVSHNKKPLNYYILNNHSLAGFIALINNFRKTSNKCVEICKVFLPW